MTTAYLLHKAGKKVMLIESQTLGAGVTSCTSGHLTAAFDMHYHQIVQDFDLPAARQVSQAMVGAINFVEQTCQTEAIECDFKRVNGYLYAELENQIDTLDKEHTASLDVGMDARLTDEVPLPFSIQRSIFYPHHAQFHSLKYIYALARRLMDEGVLLYDHTKAVKISEESDMVRVTLENGHKIGAHQVILATHSPIGLSPVHTEVAPYSSYVIAAKVKSWPGEGLFWDLYDPYHYIRQAPYQGEHILIVGGCDHKTGQQTGTRQAYEDLRQYTQDRFGIEEVLFSWSGQVFESADGLPFIGKSPLQKNVYIATGYSGDGLTWGTAAARLLTDLLTQQPNPLADVVSPARLKVGAAAKDFIKENVNVAYHFIKDRISVDARQLEDIVPGEGKIIRQGTQQVAVYRDEQGNYHGLDPVCPHMKCIVRWNTAEKSWDCPCHGGRFNCLGKMLSAPPMHDLKAVEI